VRQQLLLPSWHLVRSKRKTLELRVYPDGRVEVRAPMRATQRDIQTFVDSRQHWLGQKLSEIDARPHIEMWRCVDGARLLLWGEPHQLVCEQGSKNTVQQQDNNLLLTLSRRYQPSAENYQALLESHLRDQARGQFDGLIDRWFPFFAQRGFERPTLFVKKMKTRWGSLSVKGNINLNLALIHFSLDLVESVVVHELCHLAHMNHGPKFKALQTQLLPDWRERKCRLDAASKQLAGQMLW